MRYSPKVIEIDDIPLRGGHLALDFVNTKHSWHHKDSEDYLGTVARYLEWLTRQRPRDFELSGFDPSSPRGSAELYRMIEAARETLHTVFVAVAHQQPPDRRALARLNRMLHDAAPARWLEIAAGNGAEGVRFATKWRATRNHATGILGPVLSAAADLLASSQLDRVKECPAEDCGWLFLDQSKNRSRRWCSMSACGTTAKVRSFRARQR